MKKKLLVTMLSVVVAGSIAGGCGKTGTSAAGNVDSAGSMSTESEGAAISDIQAENQNPVPLTYSFLYDDTTREEISTVMKTDGVPDEQIDAFMATVTQFADTMGEMKGAQDGYTSVDASQVFYDYDHIGETFTKELGFSDQNCRLTAYSLFQSFYEVSEDSTFTYNDELYGDTEILKDNTNLKFSDEDMRKYTTLFTDVAVNEGEKDVTALAETVKKTWADRGITFAEQDKVQLASIMMHSASNNTVFAGHAGVVFTTDDGYLLIEKLSQYTPFVAGKFESLSELKEYMISEVAFLGGEEGSAEPFILLNDELLTE